MGKRGRQPAPIGDYYERHRLMLEYQEAIYPFTPTLMALNVLWPGSEGSGGVSYSLGRMIDAGLVIFRHVGECRRFYAIQPGDVREYRGVAKDVSKDTLGRFWFANEYLKRHSMMLEYQRSIYPFTPTVAEMCSVWGVASKNTSRRCMEQMSKIGLVIAGDRGMTKQYYAVRANWV